jgi:hypothetical protein
MELEESSTFVINNSGTYHTTCVELEITALAVNTIIEVCVMLTWWQLRLYSE